MTEFLITGCQTILLFLPIPLKKIHHILQASLEITKAYFLLQKEAFYTKKTELPLLFPKGKSDISPEALSIKARPIFATKFRILW